MSDLMERSGKKMYHGCQVEFVEEVIPDPEATAKANGQHKYKTKEIILVTKPDGDVSPAEVTDIHRQQYAEQYNAFKAGKEQPLEGTPLTHWPIIPGPVVKELSHLGVKTVEQLAEASGETKRKMGVAAKYCKQAKEWLEAANSTPAQVVALKGELEQEKAKRQKLEDQVAALLRRVEANEGNRPGYGAQ